MPTPKAGLKLMPTGTRKNEAIYNEGVTLLEALAYRGVVSRSVVDPSGISPTPANGDIYLVPDGSPNATGAWAGHGGEVAVYFDGWRFIPPDEGLTLWITDTAQSVQYRSGLWIDINESAELVPTLLGTIDLSVNNATTSEGASRQITGMKNYKHIIVTVFGLDPADADTLQMRLLTDGGTTGTTGILNGFQWVAPSTRSGLENFDFIHIASTSQFDNAHATIQGHWSTVTPTVISTRSYDNDATTADSVMFTEHVTNVSTIFDGLSFRTGAGVRALGTIKVYGWN